MQCSQASIIEVRNYGGELSLRYATLGTLILQLLGVCVWYHPKQSGRLYSIVHVHTLLNMMGKSTKIS